MKRFFSILMLLLAVNVAMATGDGKKKDKEEEKIVYVWGVSMAFTDSTVYFTEIMPVDGAVLVDGFLPNRHLYAYELKDYMSFGENMPGRTSYIYFSENRSKLEKKEVKIKKRLIDREGKSVRYLGDKFKFTKH